MFIRRIFKTIQAVFIIAMGLILALNLYLLASRLIFKSELPKVFGYAQIVVVSGSMQPAFDPGDLLIIHRESSYQVNDIVTYHSGRSLVTHRVVEAGDAHILAKGDANNVIDDPVSLSDIEGKVVSVIPGAGNFIIFMKTPLGILSMLGVLFLLIQVPYTLEHMRRKKSGDAI